MVGLERVELSSTDYESAALTVVLKAYCIDHSITLYSIDVNVTSVDLLYSLDLYSVKDHGEAVGGRHRTV